MEIKKEQTGIWAKEISMQFGDKRVLEQVTLAVWPGEIFGLLGPSGAGKTTLIKILTGQLLQSGGTAGVLGCDSRKLPAEVYAKIGMVLDTSGLYERLSCYDNLALFAEIYGTDKHQIQEALRRVELEEASRRPAGRLSKGMRQRLVLARALLNRPKLLFLDEPTSGLDPKAAAAIHRLIAEQQAQGTAIFLTTHNMEEARKLCARVALLHEGKIVECGAPDELCRRYNHRNQFHLVLKSGEQLEIMNTEAGMQKIAAYFAQNAVAGIHSTEPSLETVFMELTGKDFKDENEKNCCNF